MRRAYSAQAVSAHAGSRLLTARTRSLGTRFTLRRALGGWLFCGLALWRRYFDGGFLHPHGLAAPHFFEVVEVACSRMHDVHYDVAKIHQDPFAVCFALDANDVRAQRRELVLDVVGERFHLARRVAAG